METGKTYTVRHTRKGKFTLKVTDQNDVWISGTIVSGETNALLDYNRAYEGEEITIRKSFCSFKEIEPITE